MALRPGFIPNLDGQENSGDNIPRSMPFGMPATQGERITVSELYRTPFYRRVNEAVTQIKAGIPLPTVEIEHGRIVYRAALAKVADDAGVAVEDHNKCGARRILRPCLWCGIQFSAREMVVHKSKCEMKPKATREHRRK